MDESPMMCRRLSEVLAVHAGTIRVLHTLRFFAVVITGAADINPYKGIEGYNDQLVTVGSGLQAVSAQVSRGRS